MKHLFIYQMYDLEVLVNLRDRLEFKNIYTGHVVKVSVSDQICHSVFARS
jgi:hypothetical protein